jgi:CRP-like cAMP-binding protein
MHSRFSITHIHELTNSKLEERSFKAFDGSDLAAKKLLEETPIPTAAVVSELSSTTQLHESDGMDDATNSESMTMSDYSDLLSENMKQRYFPKGHFIYHEGEKGDHMYFLNSGTVEVITSDGIKNNRHAGDFFGEGALLHPLGTRSSTIKCKTPVHVIEINREYFEKYMASSNGTILSLREKDKIRRRNRAKALLKLQSGMITEKFKEGDTLYHEGDRGDSMYIVEEGKVDVTTMGHRGKFGSVSSASYS